MCPVVDISNVVHLTSQFRGCSLMNTIWSFTVKKCLKIGTMYNRYGVLHFIDLRDCLTNPTECKF